MPNTYLSLRQIDDGGVGQGDATTAIDLHIIDPRQSNGAKPYGRISPSVNQVAGWPILVDTPTSKPGFGWWGPITRGSSLKSNALGVSDDGFAYFTFQYDAADLRIGAPYDADFVDIWRANLNVPPNSPGSIERVAQHVLFDTKGKPTMSAGGVNPVDGKFYFARLWMNDDNTFVEANIFRYNPETGQVEHGAVNKFDVRQPLFQARIAPSSLGWSNESWGTRNSALSQSDLAFGPDGTMYLLVQGKRAGASGNGTQVAAIAPEQLLELGVHGSTAQLTTTIHPDYMATSGIEGFTITNTAGVSLVRSLDEHSLRHPFGSWFSPYVSQRFGNTDSSLGVRDLGSCSTRVYLSMNLALTVPRVSETDQFQVEATATIGTSTTPRPTSRAVGVTSDALTTTAPQSVFRTDAGEPRSIGQVQGDYVHLKTTIAERDNLDGYKVQHVCYNTAVTEPGKPGKQIYSGGDGRFPVPVAVSGAGDNAGVTPRIHCESEILAPNVGVTKTAKLNVDGAFQDFTTHAGLTTDREVYAGSELEYTIAFGNETGTHEAQIDYVDWVHDLCDDVHTDGASAWLAQACDSEEPVVIPDSAVSRPAGWEVTAEQGAIRIKGRLPSGALPDDFQLKYRVTVLENAVNAEVRGAKPGAAGQAQGYVLRNYVAPFAEGSEAPKECEPNASASEPARTACTNTPVAAWTIEKTSQPKDGAWLHSGGNIYYRVKVSKLGDMRAEHTGISLQDDISQVFAAARLDLDAPTFGGEYTTGIRFFNAEGEVVREIDASQNLANAFTPTWEGGAITDPTDPAFESKWNLGIAPMTLQEDEVRAEITYAVKVGGYADPANPQAFVLAADGSIIAPHAYAKLTNTIAGSADLPTGQPARCAVRAFNLTIDPECQVHHQIADNYFHVQKNSSSSRAGSQVWNIDGEFVLGDAPTAGVSAQANTWSKHICRVDNYVDPVTGMQSAPVGSQTGNAGVQPSNVAVDGGAFSGEEILGSIEAWNETHPEAPKQLCGLFYKHLVDADSNAGTWHAEEIPAGSYLLFDTVPAQGHELLAEPIAFDVAPAGPTSSGTTLADQLTGLGKLSIRIDAPLTAGQVRPPAGMTWDAAALAQWQLSGTSPAQNVLPTCDWLGSPANPPSDGSSACVMATGWLMHVYEPKQQKLPFTGGGWPWAATLGPALVALLVAAVWWRRRAIRAHASRGATNTKI